MQNENDLTFSKNKTKLTIYKVIGRKISDARKSSRRKLEGVSKKLNISVEILRKIESGEINQIDQEIPVAGFVRAFAKLTNADISDEIEKLQSEYSINEKPRNIYNQVPNIKASRIFVVFLSSFCFILLVLYFLSMRDSEVNNNDVRENSKIDEKFLEEDNFDKVEFDNKNNLDRSETFERQIIKKNDNFFEIIFLEETWIEVYNDDKLPITLGLYRIGDSLNFQFESAESDFFIKSGNLGGFQIFFKDEFFAPFGYSGEVSKGFFLKEKISRVLKAGL
ncbi:MAG: helix-turn-helix domain-containing protein [Alphaproteobacteria bacterium]|tara:strand:+ start:852 stop:1688 length:837 start_codon:yes stop_codon:yes gene_type:complete